MLVAFRFENYQCFRDPVELSMVASNDRRSPENVMTVNVIGRGGPQELRLLRSVGIMGPNASGKSSLCDAILALRDIVTGRARPHPDVPLPVTAFALDQRSSGAPTVLEAEFLLPSEDSAGLHERLLYGLELRRGGIVREWLFRSPKGVIRRVFERSESSGESSASFGEEFSTYGRQYLDRCDAKTPLLTRASEENNAYAQRVLGWFLEQFRAVSSDPLVSGSYGELAATISSCVDNESIRKAVVALLQRADLGIVDIRVEVGDRVVAPPNYRPAMVGNLPLICEVESKETGEPETRELRILFGHAQTKDDGTRLTEPVWFVWQGESDGTKKMFALAVPLLSCLSGPLTVVADELDRSLHPLLFRAVLEVFRGENNRGQLIFTSHTLPQLLRDDFLRDDQVLLTEKDDTGSVSLKSLSDFPRGRRRSQEHKGAVYLAGGYGAVPFLHSLAMDGTNGE